MIYALDKTLTNDIENEGSALNVNAGLRYPIIRTRLHNLYVTGNYDYKKLEDFSSNQMTNHRIFNNLTLGLNGDKLDQWLGGGLTNWGVSFTQGDLDLSGEATKFANDQSTAQTHGGFSKLTLNLARLQKLTPNWSLFASASVQPYASANLDSAEKISIGGSSAVRAYAGGEVSGDTGYLTTLEARYDIPGLLLLNGGIQLQAFVDHGGVKQQQEPWVGFNSKNNLSLTGIGVGLSWSQPQVYSVKMSYGHKIDDQYQDRNQGTKVDSEQRTNDGRFWFQAMVWL
jgi:hemolysin activation/secretion protein